MNIEKHILYDFLIWVNVKHYFVCIEVESKCIQNAKIRLPSILLNPSPAVDYIKKTVWQIIIQKDSFCLKYNSSKLMLDVNK